METLYIALGRNGDILAALPIVQHDPRACLMVASAYMDLLDGTSTRRILWLGDWRHVKAAYIHARRDFQRIIVLQQYSTDGWPSAHGTPSYVQDMYRIARKLPLFPLPLRFDRRSLVREARLVASIPHDKPLVLVATCGISSPFAQAGALLNFIEACFPQALVLDMDMVHGERLYDLLGLFECAACLVTVDSALLHLAQAVPSLPIIALIADRPTSWHGSPQYAGQRLRVRYSDFAKRSDEIIEAIAACLVTAPAMGSG
jgi:hypothetical protein